jgi:hypothetical protein
MSATASAIPVPDIRQLREQLAQRQREVKYLRSLLRLAEKARRDGMHRGAQQ